MSKGSNKLKIILITLILAGLVLSAGVVAIKFLPVKEPPVSEVVDSPDMSFEVVENTESDDISSIVSQSSESDTATDTDSDSTDTETEVATDTSSQENTSSQVDTDTTDRSSLYVDMSEILAQNTSSEYLNKDMVDYYEDNPYPEYYPPVEETTDEEIYTESTVTSSESELEIIDSSTDSDEYTSSNFESIVETDTETETEPPSETPSEDPVSSETTSSESDVNSDTTPNKVILDVPFYSQRNVMPTGCELVSAKMVLAYYGHNVTNQDILNNLVRADLTYDKWGRLCGRNPFEAFIGNPEWYSGFGCYPPVIENMIHSMGFNDLTVTNTSSQSLDELARTYLPQGKPIMVWATIGLVDSYWGDSWYLIDSNGNVTNDVYTWRANEHCMVLIGYDENYYYFNDPLAGSGAAKYEKSLVQRRYEEMGRYSLVISQY